MNTANLQALARQYHLDLLILFGSQVRGKKNHLSDIDLAFYRRKPLLMEEEMELYSELMALLKRNDIDLININSTYNTFLLHQVFMNGKLLYESDSGLFNRMRWQAYIDFQDFKRFYEQKDALIDKRIATLTNS